MWSATGGATPVTRWTWAASAIFSYGSRGTPRCANTLKRVPELPKAHEGSSIRWPPSASRIAESTVTVASVAGPTSVEPMVWRGAPRHRNDRTGGRGRGGGGPSDGGRGETLA